MCICLDPFPGVLSRQPIRAAHETAFGLPSGPALGRPSALSGVDQDTPAHRCWAQQRFVDSVPRFFCSGPPWARTDQDESVIAEGFFHMVGGSLPTFPGISSTRVFLPPALAPTPSATTWSVSLGGCRENSDVIVPLPTGKIIGLDPRTSAGPCRFNGYFLASVLCSFVPSSQSRSECRAARRGCPLAAPREMRPEYLINQS